MVVLKCKMCGGNLNVISESTICTCAFCGTQQTVPTVDDEKKVKLFERANKLRLQCEFDKAYGVYESIIEDFPSEAEAYWGLVLCKFGIEYVDDAKTVKKIPTCHRSSFDSVMDDESFEMVMENADSVARGLYRQEAIAIEELRKGIVEISSKEEPYDIFICYKEKDENGERTIDSVIAQDIYTSLTKEGYKVFFSKITLEDKLGVEYEPYIFSALHSAKVMLAVGTTYDYYHAVWVKNEWSRFLKLIEQGEDKTLVPCYKDISPYDLPKEFKNLQGQDMSKIGAMQDLVHGVGKLINRNLNDDKGARKDTKVEEGPTVKNYIKRMYDFIKSGDWENADLYSEKVLDIEYNNVEAYLGKFLIEHYVSSFEEMSRLERINFDSPNYKKIQQYGEERLKADIVRLFKENQEKLYQLAIVSMKNKEFEKAAELLDSLGNYNDSITLKFKCQSEYIERLKNAKQKLAKKRDNFEEARIKANRTRFLLFVSFIGVFMVYVGATLSETVNKTERIIVIATGVIVAVAFFVLYLILDKRLKDTFNLEKTEIKFLQSERDKCKTEIEEIDEKIKEINEMFLK